MREGYDSSHRRLGVLDTWSFPWLRTLPLKRDMPSRPRMLSVNLLSCSLPITAGWLLSHDFHVLLNHCLQKHFPPLSFKWPIPLQNSYVSSCSFLTFAWSPILSPSMNSDPHIFHSSAQSNGRLHLTFQAKLPALSHSDNSCSDVSRSLDGDMISHAGLK